MKTLFIMSMLFILSCTQKNVVNIKLDKEIVLAGDTITARLYVKHNDSILPTFYILTDYDTARIPNDERDNQAEYIKLVSEVLELKQFLVL